ncbi:hypothetical protein ACGRHY_29215 [Streptomyces sp. HK10]|uniref:hypothetical protein n=1 Tax=Streptomyces sp. HK10 TaxID=3373255 RepID=UPI00374A7BEF
MNRSLTRNILRAAYRTPVSDHPFRHLVQVEHVFPTEVFADAPRPWSPGEDFTEVMSGTWLRSNDDGTRTAVVAGVGPKQLPAADGGPWTEEEVWTVTSADPEVFAWLDDKPHRVTWALGRPDVEIAREPYATHPQATVDAYWDAFWRRHWFTPDRRPDGHYGLTLACAPNYGAWEWGPRPLATVSGRIMAALGGRAVVRNVTLTGDAPHWRSPKPVSLMRCLA